MKKFLSVLMTILLIFLLTACPGDPTFVTLDNGNIADANGVEYVFLAHEGGVTRFGDLVPLGRVKGEHASNWNSGPDWDVGMYAFEDDPEHRILLRIFYDSEFYAYYRRADLPELDLSPDHCDRFALLRCSGLGETAEDYARGAGCGITDEGRIAEFLSEIRSQPTASEAGLYDMVRNEEGRFENCYVYGRVYGFFEEEPKLAIAMDVISFNDLAYSVKLDGVEYVLPVEWVRELEADNSQ